MAQTVVATVETANSLEGTSPRSTILVGGGAPSSMIGGSPEDTSAGAAGAGDSASKASGGADMAGADPPNGAAGEGIKVTPEKNGSTEEPESPPQISAGDSTQQNISDSNAPAAIYGYPPNQQSHLARGANEAYYGVGGEPPSPGTFAAGTTAFSGTANPSTPISPSRGVSGAVSATTPTAMMVGAGANGGSQTSVPPPSPLFPRLNPGGAGLGAAANSLQQQQEMMNTANPPGSPGFGAVYAGGAGLGNGGGYPSYSNVVASQGSGSNSSIQAGDEIANSWAGDRPPSASPRVQQNVVMPAPYGFAAGTRAGSSGGGRAYSFEDAMQLPPAAMPGAEADLQQANPAYSPYGGSTTSSATTGTLFAHPSSWPPQPYTSGPSPDMLYGGAGTPASPLQPRPTSHMQPPPPPPLPHHHAHMGGYPQPVAHIGQHPHHHHLGMRPMPPAPGGYGAGPQPFPFGATSSPGPPIQTTASNKGPDGANLFIFHIPNHFTNLDMYQLFEPYGNLLSVRIMVEKDTGRSRGFGFVSYDSPESAALAIKALNGFAIGNKRLKVQHKQIRPKDMHERDQPNGYGNPGNDGFGHHHQQQQSLPPAGGGWYNDRKVPNNNAGAMEGQKAEDQTELTSTSTTADTPSLGGLGAGSDQPSASLSPLASLGSLQAALPDVGGGKVVNPSPAGTNDASAGE